MSETGRAPMSTTWMERARVSLEDARFLLHGGRSAQAIINRAYYAMFYATMALLETEDQVPRKHSGTIALFDKLFVRSGAFDTSLSKDLHRAFELRQAYDYGAPVGDDEGLPERTLTAAEAFVEAIAGHLRRSDS